MMLMLGRASDLLKKVFWYSRRLVYHMATDHDRRALRVLVLLHFACVLWICLDSVLLRLVRVGFTFEVG